MSELNINKSVTIDALQVISVERNNGNGTRKAFLIQNTSLLGEKISVSIGAEAVLGAGIVLSPGGVWSDTADSGYLPTQQQITAIASAITATLAIQERVEA